VTRNTLRVFTAVVAVVALLGASGCSKHDDPSSPLAIVTPPTPTNLVIVDNLNATYDISWDIVDEASVKNYRTYSFDFVRGVWVRERAEPDVPEWYLNTVINLSGLPIGVTAVTHENVESEMLVGFLP
jgi:hypothetical protein